MKVDIQQIDCHPPHEPIRNPMREPGLTAALMISVLLVVGAPANAANILWVSDASPAGFSGPGTSFTDQGFVKLLQDAGHNIARYNGPDTATTLLTQAEIDAINTNDCVIISRAAGSGAWVVPQGAQWNTNITRPLMCMSPYLVRTTGTRMSWFAGDVGPDDTPVPWTPGSAENPIIDYVFGTVAMSGANTAELFQEPMDRNTSHILGAPAPGSLIIATATFPQEGAATISTGNALVLLPPGTIAGGAALPAARMYMSAGTRESATVPNAIGFATGRENLTPTGERVFLRAVDVLLKNGVAPSTNSGPASIITQPASLTVLPGSPAKFTVAAAGAAPRLIEWQRENAGGGFTAVSGASSAFASSAYTLPSVALADNGARFRAVISNSLTIVTSDVVTLSVILDVAPLQVQWGGSLSGTNVVISFNNALEASSAIETLNYFVDPPGLDIWQSVVRPDGHSVILTLSAPFSSPITITVDGVKDVNGNTANGQSVLVRNLALTGVDVGALNPAGGTEAPSGANSFSVTGGGLDIASTTDIMRFAYKTVTGDFEAVARVQSLTGVFDHLEAVAKAALVARDGVANNAAGVTVFATPPAPGDEKVFAHYRSTAGAATNLLGQAVSSKPPGTWLRIRRVVNDFTTSHSTNGLDWTTIGSATIPLNQTLLVGVGVSSHRNGKTVTGTFSDLRIGAIINPITLTSSLTSTDFKVEFQSANGVTYTPEYTDTLGGTTWIPMSAIPGDGSVKSFTEPKPLASRRFYRVRAE